ncbi:MAG: phosphopantetheine-binding protein [Mariprofundales bacterium]
MSLDFVALIMAIEDEFGIHIDNDDILSNITTPEKAANYVYSHVRKSKNDPCLSQKGFYKVSRIITQTFNIERNKIKPASSLNDILGNDIKSNWKKLHESIGIKDFPRLKRKSVLFYSAVLIMPLFIIIPDLFNNVQISLVIAKFLFLSIIFNLATYPMANAIPIKYKCVSSLIPYVECSKNTIWEKDKIIIRIIEITSEQLFIPIEGINKDSHFVHDLGAGC